MSAHRHAGAHAERHRATVAANGANLLVHRHPCRQPAQLVALRRAGAVGDVHLPLHRLVPRLGECLLVDVPCQGCEVAVEFPADGFAVVVVLVLDVAHRSHEVVAVHERQRAVGEREVYLVARGREVEL